MINPGVSAALLAACISNKVNESTSPTDEKTWIVGVVVVILLAIYILWQMSKK